LEKNFGNQLRREYAVKPMLFETGKAKGKIVLEGF